METNYPVHKEPFRVVLIKNGVSEMTATPEDFKEVIVEAADPLAALMSDEAGKVPGHRVLFTTKPGVLTDAEVLARRRALEGPEIDRTKL